MACLALLFAAAWVPLTSHELLEAAGWIHHEEADADEGPAHEAADGLCRPTDAGILVKSPMLIAISDLLPVIELSLASLVDVPSTPSYLRQETESPPGLVRRWQFVLRLALPGRAPSFAS